MMRAIALFGLLALSGCNAVTNGLSCENREDCSPAQDCFPVIGGCCSRGCVTGSRSTVTVCRTAGTG